MENCVFLDNKGFNYYSNSTDNIVITNLFGKNNGCLLQGANISDNVIFGPVGGIQRAVNMKIDGFTAIGGVNSQTTQAIQFGAISNYDVQGDSISDYETGILFHGGNNGNNSTATRGTVKFNTIKNCNPLNNVHNLHCAILFTKPGDYEHLTVEVANVYDDRSIAFMQVPAFFEDKETPAVVTLSQTGGIINIPVLVSGGTGYPSSVTNVPVVISDTTGINAVITGNTNSLGVITSLNLVNAGTGYTAPTATLNSNNAYYNVIIQNSNLKSYAGNDSIKKKSTVILDNSVRFNNITNAIKGTLSPYYDRELNNIVSTISDASVANKGLVNTIAQTFAGLKKFNSNDTFLGTGIDTANSVFSNIGNLGTNNTNYWESRSSNVANINNRIVPKGSGRVETPNGGLEELKLNLTTTTTFNANALGVSNIYTVPAGRKLVITKVVLLTNTITGTVTTPPSISIGANANNDDYMPINALTNATTANKAFIYQPNLNGVTFYNAAEIIGLKVTTAQIGATALTYTINLFGYLI